MIFEYNFDSEIALKEQVKIRISGIVQLPFSKHSVPLNAAEGSAYFSDNSTIFMFRIKFKTFHQIRGFRVIFWPVFRLVLNVRLF